MTLKTEGDRHLNATFDSPFSRALKTKHNTEFYGNIRQPRYFTQTRKTSIRMNL